MTDPGRSGGEGTGWHMHAGRYVHRALCAGTPVIVLDPVTARDTIARVVLHQLVMYTLPANFGRALGEYESYETVAERCAPMITEAIIEALRRTDG